MSYEIESNVPPPKKSQRNKYPFDDMKVGDSFFVPLEKADPSSVRNSAFSHAQRRDDFAVSVRHVTKDGVKTGVRVWRVAKATEPAK